MEEYINQKTGERLRCTFSLTSDRAPDEAAVRGLIECLREEYGDTYVDKRVYDYAWMTGEVTSGRLLIGGAFTEDGTAAAYTCLRENAPFFGVGDLCMHVVRRCFRGFGISTPLVAWLVRQVEADRFCAIGSHSATFHAISQRTSYACGLRPCGMLFGLYKSAGFVHSHENIGAKMNYAVATMPRRRETVSLCVPEEWREFLADHYRQVDTPVRWLEPTPPMPTGDVQVMQDDAHGALTLCVHRCGTDLGETVRALLARYENEPLQTVTACVDLSDPTAPWGYETLKAQGFFFCGVQPFCRGRHYLLLHHPMRVDIPFDHLCIDEKYEAMFRCVQTAFEKGNDQK